MRLLLYCVLLIIVQSCTSKSKKSESDNLIKVSNDISQEFYYLDLESSLKNLQNKEELVSKYVNDIEYVPLETTNESLLGSGRHQVRILAATSKIIVADMKLFSRQDGRYLGDLLSPGQGPQEYLCIASVAADDENEEVYLFDSSKQQIFIVGYDTVYKGVLPCGSDSQLYSIGNGKLLIARSSSLQFSYDDYYIQNIETRDIITKRRSSALSNLKSLDDCANIVSLKGVGPVALGGNVFWEYENNLRYYDYLTDSIYSINKKFEVSAIGYINWNNLKITKEQFMVGYMSRDFPTWHIEKIVETKSELFISFLSILVKPSGEVTPYSLIYSKKDKSSKAMLRDRERKLLQNDYDGGVPFSPNYQVHGENASFVHLSPDQIIEQVQRKIPNDLPQDRVDRFRKMAKTLKYDDNEVVAILKWKE